MKKLTVVLIVVLFFQPAQAQENNTDDHTESKSLLSFFKEGEAGGHIRNYFMGTVNTYGNDYYANATGGALHYKTQWYKGWQLGVSGIFTYKIFSNDLTRAFAQTTKTSRWEQELFDVNHKGNYKDLDRLEELYIKYKWKHAVVTYGKIPVEYTPLLNKSDGRMKPFSFQGVWLHYKDEKFRSDMAWIYKVSPRSMTDWFSVDDAIGLMDNGYQPDGTKADYKQHISSHGVAIIHAGNEIKNIKIDFWNYYIDQLLNTSWLQMEYTKQHLVLGAIYSYQIPHQSQKHKNYTNRYVQPDENGQVLSLMGKYTAGSAHVKVAYSRSFKSGRYLFPKELGRDQFYTSIPRSRMEGIAHADVFTIGYQYHYKQLLFELDAVTTFGIFSEKVQFNKYKIDDYYQVNARLHYEFSKSLKGLKIEMLYVWKQNKKIHHTQLVSQRSDYNQINIITNLNF
jgi:hypothetical protein